MIVNRILPDTLRHAPNEELIKYGYFRDGDTLHVLSRLESVDLEVLDTEYILELIQAMNRLSQRTSIYSGEPIPIPLPANLQNIQGILLRTQQTFLQQELYPFLEDKAANLMYNLIKNHPLENGNKRTGYAGSLFFYTLNVLTYLERSGSIPTALTTRDESLRDIFDLDAHFIHVKRVASSQPEEKDRVIEECLSFFLKIRTKLIKKLQLQSTPDRKP